MILLPDKIKAKAYCYNLKFFGEQEKELTHLSRIVGKVKQNAVDVGANFGYYSFELEKLFNHVYAFEINPEVSFYLEANQSKKISVIKCGLSDESGFKELSIPVVKGNRYNGWGSLEKRELDFTSDFIKKTCSVKTLDSFDLKDINFIKIDVEGHEVSVIKGGLCTISRWLPIILCETGGENLKSIEKMLGEFNYEVFTLEQLTGIKGETYNIILMPPQV